MLQKLWNSQKGMNFLSLSSAVVYQTQFQDPGSLPSWGGMHALITDANDPLMRVGFLPIIPSLDTDYATVLKALNNFKLIANS